MNKTKLKEDYRIYVFEMTKRFIQL